MLWSVWSSHATRHSGFHRHSLYLRNEPPAGSLARGRMRLCAFPEQSSVESVWCWPRCGRLSARQFPLIRV